MASGGQTERDEAVSRGDGSFTRYPRSTHKRCVRESAGCYSRRIWVVSQELLSHVGAGVRFVKECLLWD